MCAKAKEETEITRAACTTWNGSLFQSSCICTMYRQGTNLDLPCQKLAIEVQPWAYVSPTLTFELQPWAMEVQQWIVYWMLVTTPQWLTLDPEFWKFDDNILVLMTSISRWWGTTDFSREFMQNGEQGYGYLENLGGLRRTLGYRTRTSQNEVWEGQNACQNGSGSPNEPIAETEPRILVTDRQWKARKDRHFKLDYGGSAGSTMPSEGLETPERADMDELGKGDSERAFWIHTRRSWDLRTRSWDLRKWSYDGRQTDKADSERVQHTNTPRKLTGKHGFLGEKCSIPCSWTNIRRSRTRSAEHSGRQGSDPKTSRKSINRVEFPPVKHTLKSR